MTEFENLSAQEIAEVRPLGEESRIYITKMRQPVVTGEVPSDELLVGNVLRRLCKFGGELCGKSGCQAPEFYTNQARDCADINLDSAIFSLLPLDVDPLMVSVTKDRVGFYDEIDNYVGEGIVSSNSQGIMETTGFNAFFVKADENVALGARLADCGFLGVEFEAGNGDRIVGFMHMSRPNMQGESAFKYTNQQGSPVGSFEYFLQEGLHHYNAPLDSVKVRMVAAITAENFEHQFADIENLENRFPGWIEQGLMVNASNPNWRPGDPINPDDKWLPQYREMIEWQVKRAGITDEQFITDDAIDPGDLELGHASNHAGAHGTMPDARDLYMVSPRAYSRND